MAADYTDDLSIGNEAGLWRRIPPWHFIYDENRAGWRPSSAAFANGADAGPMSVVLADIVLGAGRSPISVLEGLEGFALASVTAGLARACGQGVTRDPTAEEPAHALVFGAKPRSVQRRLAKAALWVIPPKTNTA